MKDNAICVKAIDSIELHGRINHVVVWIGNNREIQTIFAVNCIPIKSVERKSEKKLGHTLHTLTICLTQYEVPLLSYLRAQ